MHELVCVHTKTFIDNGKYYACNYITTMTKKSVGNCNMHDILISTDYEDIFTFDS